MKTNPFDAFQAVPSPANAVRLAVSDLKAANLIDWPFIDALNKGADQLDDRAALIDLLKRAAGCLHANAAHDLASEIEAKLATL